MTDFAFVIVSPNYVAFWSVGVNEWTLNEPRPTWKMSSSPPGLTEVKLTVPRQSGTLNVIAVIVLHYDCQIST